MFALENLWESEVVAAMRFIDGNSRDFQTQSLRIGGHTFLLSNGLPEDFVNFLGRRKIKRRRSYITELDRLIRIL